MQELFDFTAGDLAFIRRSLTRAFGRLTRFERRDPVWRMTRSLIGCRTQDEVAEPALARLMARWPHPRLLAAAPAAQVERVIGDVTYAEDKSVNLVAALGWIGRERPDYDLSFLCALPVHEALAWLERLPGVGPKVAAATLNASTLRMPVFIVDCHVHRVLVRFGFIARRATAKQARDVVTAAATSLGAEDLLELFVQMKRLGQEFCHHFRTDCAACPLAARCRKVAWTPPAQGFKSPSERSTQTRPRGSASRALERSAAAGDPSNLIRLTPA